jgi:outer membrane protein OmpA-like peptidoglycan-associated protein
MENDPRVLTYRTTVNPKYKVYGGITWSGFLLAQDRDGDGVTDNEDNCPDDFGHRLNQGCPLGNPDVDEDGVCDAWVSEKGFENEFRDVCEGIDACPNEQGEGEDGCPLEDPDPDGDHVCDAWVSKKKLQKKFKEVCEGIDSCPTEKGTVANKGCPEDNPDPDGDGMCSPWVTDKNKLGDYANVCKGYDMCPGEAGTKANKGCPAENPDSDGDGLCDAWVGKQKMFDQFKDVCKGADRCPDEAGPEWNKGCPMDDDPDADKDGVCSEWVSTKKLLKQFEGVCTGLDRCPDVAGDDGHGCPKKAVEKLTGVTFKPGKATLESNAKNILKAVAKKLNEDDSYKELKIVIQGHTDNKGKDKTNQKLSEKRAQEVMKTLIKFGVKKNRIKAVGLGASCPVDDNSTEDGREMNRRNEMHFATPENAGTKCESEFQQ